MTPSFCFIYLQIEWKFCIKFKLFFFCFCWIEMNKFEIFWRKLFNGLVQMFFVKRIAYIFPYALFSRWFEINGQWFHVCFWNIAPQYSSELGLYLYSLFIYMISCSVCGYECVWKPSNFRNVPSNACTDRWRHNAQAFSHLCYGKTRTA